MGVGDCAAGTTVPPCPESIPPKRGKERRGGTTVPHVTKRRLFATAAGAALGGLAASTGAGAQEMPPHERELYEAAKREGEITWYSGQYSAEGSEAVGRGFGERYPGVRCNVVRSTS